MIHMHDHIITVKAHALYLVKVHANHKEEVKEGWGHRVEGRLADRMRMRRRHLASTFSCLLVWLFSHTNSSSRYCHDCLQVAMPFTHHPTNDLDPSH